MFGLNQKNPTQSPFAKGGSSRNAWTYLNVTRILVLQRYLYIVFAVTFIQLNIRKITSNVNRLFAEIETASIPNLYG